MENKIFFLILPKYNSTQMQQLQHWYSKWNLKKFVYLHEIGSSLLIKTAYNPAFYFNMGKKLWIYIFSSTFFCYYRKHPSKDNKVCPRPCSSCFQQHFQNWFYVPRYNSDLPKLEWTLLLFNFKYIRDLTNIRKLFSIPVAGYASFPKARGLKTNLLGLISNISKYYFKTGTICLLFLIFTCIYRFGIW